MNSIFELLLKLPTVTDVSIKCHSMNPVLFPLKDTVHSLQLTYYWWQEAQAEMNSYTQEGKEIVEESTEKRIALRPPTLIGVYEQLGYIKEQLKDLSTSTQQYLESVPLPMGVKYKVEQGYNKVMEAMFNADISTKYYDEFNRHQSGK